MSKKPEREPAAFELKGSLFTLTVLHLLKSDLNALALQLSHSVKQTPKFFHHMPVVIDLHKLPADSAEVDFTALMNCLREYSLIPVGTRGGNPQQHEAALSAGLAVFPNTKTDLPEIAVAPTATVPATAAQNVSQTEPTETLTKLITQPVRSGQQIYARNADLIILAPVSPGAELLADGNIHVYGTLRGRALAGISGNENSRIFCQQLDAELVSIAGHYWVNEDLQNSPIKENAHIYLENDRLHIGTY